METLVFAGTVVLITASGALAPGPLFFANISQGAKTGAKSGIVFSVAHNLIELCLVAVLAIVLTIGLQYDLNQSALNQGVIKFVIGVLGGIVIMIFGFVQIRNSIKTKSTTLQESGMAPPNLFLVGLAFTGLNPFFIIWWLTAGAQLIIISLEFSSYAGVAFMYICHVWMDYVWLTITAYLARKGISVVGLRWFRLLMIALGAILVYFGLTFILGAIGS